MLLSSYFVSTIGVVVLVYVLKELVKLYRFYSTILKLPGPPGQPIIGNFYQLFSNPDDLFKTFRAISRQYFPIYKLTNFHIVVVSLQEPSDVEQILSSIKHLSKSRVYTFLNQWLGTGLLTSTGAKWQKRRKILTPAFHFNILQQFISVFNEETEKFVKDIETLEDKSAVNVIPHVTHFTLKSITETAMGSTQFNDQQQKEYRDAIHDIGKVFFKRLAKPWLVSQRLYDMTFIGKQEKKIVEILHKYSNYVISRREKTFDSTVLTALTEDGNTKVLKKQRLAMLDLLLSAKLKGDIIDNEGIREEVDTFMFEGHDTTAASISLTLMLLASHREIQDKIAEEIFEVLGDSGRSPNHSDLQELKYMEMCIKESLRIYPSVPFISRFAGEDLVTSTGHKIPKGAIIHIHIYDLHRNPEIFPDPEKFCPERFSPENSKNRHPFAYVPFSAGPRNCIGQKFAMLEIKSALCGILRKFILEPVDTQDDMNFVMDMILRTTNGIRVKFVPRCQA